MLATATNNSQVSRTMAKAILVTLLFHKLILTITMLMPFMKNSMT
jgi:hypothetical protein